MKRNKMMRIGLFLLIYMTVAVFSSVVARAENEQQERERTKLKQEIKEEVKQQIAEMGMQLLTGDDWMKAPLDDKVAFIWGICHVVTLEQALMKKLPSLKVENFSAKAAKGLAGLKINDIVSAVDEYFASDPAKSDVPVVKVIWDELIKPKLKTGIAGYPLQ